MKLFSSFFAKAPPTAPTSAERIAVPNLESDEQAFRVAAIAKLPDGDNLRQLAGVEFGGATVVGTPAAIEHAARARMAQLIDAGLIDYCGFCAAVKDRAALFSVVALCKDHERLPQALALVTDLAQIGQLVLDSSSSRVRQSAAALLQDPTQLRALLKQVRGKDKNVYKILKEKCDRLHAAEREALDKTNEINALCESIERHSHKSFDGFYSVSFEHLAARWLDLGQVTHASTAERALQAIERCRAVIAENQRVVAQKVALQAAQVAARDAREQALQADQVLAAENADAEARLREEVAAAREREGAARAQKMAAENHLFRQIGGLIRNANSALVDGNTQKAAGLRRAIQEKWPTFTVPPHLPRQLQQLDEKLNELKQWKDFAVAPKRVELIEEMERLVASTEEPSVLAERIKSLQQDWRTISKGIVSDTGADWERFHKASQSAYQPCREYFEAQAKLRHENLEKRKALNERLKAFEASQSGEHPDKRLCAKVLREAPREWRQHFPVDRQDNRPIESEFDESIKRIRIRLNAWHDKNVADKQALIKRAQYLFTQEDGRETSDAMKHLQVLWKECGPAPRDQDQVLWNEFRESCDAVYQKRQQAFVEYTAGLEAAKVKAIALCEEVERVAQFSDTALIEGMGKIPAWRAEFDALDEMPKNDARGLHARFERALGACGVQVEKQRMRDAEQAESHLFEASLYVQAYERAVAGNVELSEQQRLREIVDTFISNVRRWPKGGLQVLKERLANAGSATESEIREKALKMLCIRAEIRSETNTPAEDEALRREFQVQRLMQMGKGTESNVTDWDSMILEWIRVGAANPLAYDKLLPRFMRCLATRLRQ